MNSLPQHSPRVILNYFLLGYRDVELKMTPPRELESMFAYPTDFFNISINSVD